MITLKKLDGLILKSCSVVNKEKDNNEFYSFSIDFDKLDNLLSQVDKNLHPLVDSQKKFSIPVGFDSIQSITEYIHKPDELKFALADKTEYAEFLIYCAQDKNGKVVDFKDENGNTIDAYEVYKEHAEDGSIVLNNDVVRLIVSTLPMYMVLVLRSFNKKNYKYDYKIYIRSNYEMVSYFKAMSNLEDKKETKTASEEKKN